MGKSCFFTIIFVITSSILICSSCGEELHVKIGYVKNNTNSDLAGVEWGEFISDSVLCHNRINLDYYLQPGLSEELSTWPGKGDLNDLPDSSKQYIFIFNLDSLNKYQKLHICEGIVKHCLVKKITIQLNKVKEPMDTVFINSNKPGNLQ
jgi:hypothetical protein